MKAVLVIEMPDKYADRYNVNEMYVWGLTVQDKHGYEMFDLVTDKPNHLKPMPKKLYVEANNIEDVMHTEMNIDNLTAKIILDTDKLFALGWNACLDEIMGETDGYL